MDYVLEMKNITKDFSGVRALNNVNFSVKRGEIHGLVGENGAGKSTLMKILSGVYPAGTYEGEIIVDKKKVEFKSPRDSQEEGIAIIYQELALVGEMSIAENVLLNHEYMKKGVIDWVQIYSEAQKWLAQVGLDEDPRKKINELTVGKQQLIEIAKALTTDSKIIILDEPTAALTDNEVEILLNILRDLKAKGVTCIYISHKLDEIFEITDTVTVLRDGETISTDPTENLNEEIIISRMVGRKITDVYPYQKRKIGDVLLDVKDFTVTHRGTGKVIIDHASFSLRKGEILGVAGLMGSGRTELFTSLIGSYPGIYSGTINIEGKEVTIKDPRDAINKGIAYVSEDRKRYGLIMEMDIKQNTTLASLNQITKNGVIDGSLETKRAEEMNDRVKTKAPNIETKVINLSGGNQQKVVLSKWLMTDPKILILDEPTRGIDVGAKYEIYKIINELASEGVGIILISSELPEVLGMSDRIVVMSEGKITGQLSREEATQEKIMTLATGGNLDEK